MPPTSLSLNQSSNLIHGSNVLSKRLKIFINPMGFLYQFDSSEPPKPKASKNVIFFLVGFCLFVMVVMYHLVWMNIRAGHDEILSASGSTFLEVLFKTYVLYRMFMILSAMLITIGQQASISAILSTSSNMISRRKQASLATNSFYVHAFRSVSKCFLVIPVFWSEPRTLVLMVTLLTILDMAVTAPLMYTCYLASALGEHVKNFSKIYVDSMFDQFMKALEQEMPAYRRLSGSSLGAASSVSRLSLNYEDDENCDAAHRTAAAPSRSQAGSLRSWFRHLVRLLKSNKYHELPEMKMTKLSSSNRITISQSIRNTNCSLIEARLRKTQLMLSELRDVVHDINKMSSAICFNEIIHDAFIVILVTTGSIHLKLYRSLNFSTPITIGAVLNLTILVYYTCTCLDRTVSELKLMINKLFDFIIMNHNDDGDIKLDSNKELASETLTETWSQFQYTRQLAGTIQFFMGGILPVSRRLVLSVLTHVLSAVFISIEVMSIVDTTATASTVCCDEAIDELADYVGKSEQVSELTRLAMCGPLNFREALSKRLGIIQVSRQTLTQFVQDHEPRLSDHIEELVRLLHKSGVHVYLVSGGFDVIIHGAAKRLNIPVENVFANSIQFHHDGSYAGFNPSNPTSNQDGKSRVIALLRERNKYKNIVMVGDGVTDLEACPPADAFIGFGGNQVRPAVRDNCPWFVYSFRELITELQYC